MLCVVLRRGKEKERERKVRGGQNQGKVERVKRKGGWGWVGGGAMMSDIRNAGS